MVLTEQNYVTLLRLLFHSDSKTFAWLKASLFSAFPAADTRLKACTAALLLLEDSRALSTAQRLAGWYIVWAGHTGHVSSHPFSAYLVAVEGDARRSNAERKVVAQLLVSHKVEELVSQTPLDYALSYSLSYVSPSSSSVGNGPSNAAAAVAGSTLEAKLVTLRQQLLPGAYPSTTDQLDRLFQEKRQQLLQGLPDFVTGGSLKSNTSGGGVNGKHAQQTPPPSQQFPFRFGAGRSSGGGNPTPTASPPPPPQFTMQMAQGNGQGGGRINHANGSLSPPNGIIPHRVSSGQQGTSTSPVQNTNALATPKTSPSNTNADDNAVTSTTSNKGGKQQQGPATPLTESQITQVRDLVDRALSGPLMTSQQTLVINAMGSGSILDFISQFKMLPESVPSLVAHTPGIAVDLFMKLHSTPVFLDYLPMLAQGDMSLHSMEVVNKLTSCLELPTEFLHLYISNCIRSCESTQDKYVQSRLVRLLCVFLQSLIRNRVIQITDLLHEVQSFCVNFSRIREAAKLFRLLKHIESGGRLGAGDGTGSPGGGLDNGLDVDGTGI